MTTPNISDEKISGDTATVDITNGGKTTTLPLVKEGGKLKIAHGKSAQTQGSSPGAGSPTQAPSRAEDKEAEEGDGESAGHEDKED